MLRVLAAALLAVAAQPLAAREIAIDIRVAGAARITSETMDRATALASNVLRASGLEPRWIDCRGDRAAAEACQRPGASNEFIVTILPAQPDPDSCVCGIAQRPLDGTPGSFITIYGECVRNGANAFRIDAGTVLSVTIVHEIGHLLLQRGHAFAGIMRARLDAVDWARAERGVLLFSSSQAARLRAAARARQVVAAATASPDGS